MSFLKKLIAFLREDNSSSSSLFYYHLGTLLLLTQLFLWLQSIWLIQIEIIPIILSSKSNEYSQNMLVDLFFTSIVLMLHIGTFRSWFWAIKIDCRSSKMSDNKSFEPNQMIVGKEEKRCELCKMRKGKNVHHCSICQRCIEGMDHHCFFIRNCVGRKNYNFFFSYAFYTVLNCLLQITLAHHEIKKFLNFDFDRIYVSIWRLLVIYICAWGFLFFMSSLLFYHFFLILNEKTTLEDKYSKKESLYTWCKILKILCSCEKRMKKELAYDFKMSWIRIFGEFSLKSLFWPEEMIKSI